MVTTSGTEPDDTAPMSEERAEQVREILRRLRQAMDLTRKEMKDGRIPEEPTRTVLFALTQIHNLTKVEITVLTAEPGTPDAQMRARPIFDQRQFDVEAFERRIEGVIRYLSDLREK